MPALNPPESFAFRVGRLLAQDAFDLDERIYIDSCHVNPRGNRIVAERMDALVGHLLGPGSTSGDSSR